MSDGVHFIEEFLLATQLHGQYVALQARDSLHLAVMQRQGLFRMLSADRHFDGIPGLVRLDPASWPVA